jgi:hypothetical protein
MTGDCYCLAVRSNYLSTNCPFSWLMLERFLPARNPMTSCDKRRVFGKDFCTTRFIPGKHFYQQKRVLRFLKFEILLLGFTFAKLFQTNYSSSGLLFSLLFQIVENAGKEPKVSHLT